MILYYTRFTAINEGGREISQLKAELYFREAFLKVGIHLQRILESDELSASLQGTFHTAKDLLTELLRKYGKRQPGNNTVHLF